MMFIHRQSFLVVATTLMSWWWLSSLLLLTNRLAVVVAAVDSSSSSAAAAAAETAELVRTRRQQRRAQDGTDSTSTTTTTITTEIVGGETVSPSAYPYFAYASYNASATSSALCGGTMIHPDILLTSADCASAFAVGKKVYIGGDSFSLEVEKTFAHPSYIASPTFYNNIMLVKLKGMYSGPLVSLNRFRLLTWMGRNAAVIGYGTIYVNGGPISSTLQRAILKIMPRSQCTKRVKIFDYQTEFCAGVRLGGKGACVGDGGSPLLIGGGVQHGIVNYITSPCGADVVSTVLTRVSRFYEWIWYYACENTSVKTGQCG